MVGIKLHLKQLRADEAQHGTTLESEVKEAAYTLHMCGLVEHHWFSRKKNDFNTSTFFLCIPKDAKKLCKLKVSEPLMLKCSTDQ